MRAYTMQKFMDYQNSLISPAIDSPLVLKLYAELSLSSLSLSQAMFHRSLRWERIIHISRGFATMRLNKI